MKKAIALFMAAMMLLTVLAGCGGAKSGEVTTPSASQTEGTTEATEATTVITEYTGELPDVPENVSYNNYEVVFLTSGNTTYNDFDFDDTAATVIDVAQYQRKLTAEEKLGIVISQQTELYNNVAGGGAGYDLISKSVSANEQSYDFANIGGYAVANLALNGNLYNIRSVPGIDLSKSWWDQNANNDLDINGLMFYTTGEITGTRSGCTFVIFYNKGLGALKGLTAPYDAVRNGTWTIDVFSEMCREASEDLNGDDVMNENDRYGLYVWDDAMVGIMVSSGTRCVTIKDNGEVELTINSEKANETFNKFSELVFNRNYTFAYQRIKGQSSWEVTNAFMSDQALFWAAANSVTKRILDMDSDYSLLPYPKYNENQDRYYSSMAPFMSQFICIPLIQEDVERTGVIVEVLAYYGQRLLTPAIYEKTEKGFQVRDEDSAEMMKIIYNSFMYDIGYLYRVGQYHEGIMDLLRNYSTSFTTMVTSSQRPASMMIKNINNSFTKLADKWAEN